MGVIHVNKGELDKALDCFQQALSIFEGIGAKPEIEKAKKNIKAIRREKK